MSAIDIRTTFLLCGLLYAVLAGGAWLASAAPREPANASWFGAGVAIGSGLLLLGLCGMMLDWIARDVGQLLIMLGCIVLPFGVRMKLGRPWPARAAWLTCTFAVAGYIMLRAAGQDVAARVLCIGSEGVSVLLVSINLWRLGRARSFRGCYWMALVFALTSAGLTVRVGAILLAAAPIEPLGALNEVARGGYDVLIMLVPCVFAAVVGNLGYLGLELQESAQHASRLAANQIRQEYSTLLMAQIAHLERQRSLAEMATTLAHELKQPLTAILSNAQVAQRLLRRLAPAVGEQVQADSPQGELAAALDRAVTSTRHSSGIINRISGYARATTADKQLVEVDGVVRGVLDMLAGEAERRQARLHFQGLAAAALVLADAVQISQVLVNLLRNSMQAMQDAAVRDIYIAVSQHDGLIEITVRDTGPGLAEEVAAKAGTPFFTTRPDGMGVGLSISTGIAAQHQGALRLANAPEGGALATLTLPEAFDNVQDMAPPHVTAHQLSESPAQVPGARHAPAQALPART